MWLIHDLKELYRRSIDLSGPPGQPSPNGYPLIHDLLMRLGTLDNFEGERFGDNPGKWQMEHWRNGMPKIHWPAQTYPQQLAQVLSSCPADVISRRTVSPIIRTGSPTFCTSPLGNIEKTLKTPSPRYKVRSRRSPNALYTCRSGSTRLKYKINHSGPRIASCSNHSTR